MKINGFAILTSYLGNKVKRTYLDLEHAKKSELKG